MPTPASGNGWSTSTVTLTAPTWGTSTCSTTSLLPRTRAKRASASTWWRRCCSRVDHQQTNLMMLKGRCRELWVFELMDIRCVVLQNICIQFINRKTNVLSTLHSLQKTDDIEQLRDFNVNLISWWKNNFMTRNLLCLFVLCDWDVSLQASASLIKLKFSFLFLTWFFYLMGVYFTDMDWQPAQSVLCRMSTEDGHKPPTPAKADFNFWPFFIICSPGSGLEMQRTAFFSFFWLIPTLTLLFIYN